MDNDQKTFIQIKDLKLYQNLQLSLMGRIATVKMNVLPKILFLFQNLPILSSLTLINDLDKALRKFIGLIKKSSIKAKYLQKKKENGGFAYLNLIAYYQASALTWVKDWCFLSNTNILSLEGLNLPLGWHAYLWMEGKFCILLCLTLFGKP